MAQMVRAGCGCGTGGCTVLYDHELSAPAPRFTISAIPPGYIYLELIEFLSVGTTFGPTWYSVHAFNADYGSNYGYVYTGFNNSGDLHSDAGFFMDCATGNPNDALPNYSVNRAIIPSYDRPYYKTVEATATQASGYLDDAGLGGEPDAENIGAYWRNVAPITQIEVMVLISFPISGAPPWTSPTPYDFLAGSRVILLGCG